VRAVAGWVASFAAVSLLLATPSALAQPVDPAVGAPVDPAFGAPDARPGVIAYQAPVDGPVARVFDPPPTPYDAGHRGLDLRAPAGSAVRAAADGTVRHAGPVAGVVWVSIEHSDGVVTSYGPLDALVVRAGEAVERGQHLGIVADGGHGGGGRDTLHFGARRDGAYFDPAGLLAPLRPALVGPGGWRGSAHVVRPYEPWQGARWGGLMIAPSPVADRPGYAVAPSGNHLVLLNGVGTRGDDVPLDFAHLGYDPSSVTAFSYAGRHDLRGDPSDPWRDQLPYGPEHTWPGIPEAARRLEQQLRAQYAREPGRAVDLAGHSMGGIVAMYYLTYLHDPYDPGLPPIGKVVTIASPLRGSDLADTGRWLRAHDGIRPLLDLALWLPLGRPQRALTPLDMPAIDQLATGSALLSGLAADWERAMAAGAAGPLAMGTRVVTVGGSRDLVATPGRTATPTTLLPIGVADTTTTHVVAPGGHEGVKRTEAVRQIAWESLRGRTIDYPSGTLTSGLTDDAGSVMRVLGRIANVIGTSSARPPGRGDRPVDTPVRPTAEPDLVPAAVPRPDGPTGPRPDGGSTW
jgi:alpha-beta hydrolase superfamily lysophospholipase